MFTNSSETLFSFVCFVLLNITVNDPVKCVERNVSKAVSCLLQSVDWVLSVVLLKMDIIRKL